MLDQKVFKILCCFFLSRPMILDLNREKTQIRLRIYNTDTGKLEKCYILEYIIMLIFCSFSYNRDMPHCSVLF